MHNVSYSVVTTCILAYLLPLTILTATTVVGSVLLMPFANARTTTPNAPCPSLGPTLQCFPT